MTKVFTENLGAIGANPGEVIAFDGTKWGYSDESHGVPRPVIIAGDGYDGTNSFASAAFGYFLPFMIDVPTTVKRMGVMVGTTSDSTDFEVGIYDKDGTRLVSGSGTVSGTSRAEVVNISDTALDPGRYYAGFSPDTGGSLFFFRNNDNGVGQFSGSFGIASSYPLPSTIEVPTSSLLFTSSMPVVFLLTEA